MLPVAAKRRKNAAHGASRGKAAEKKQQAPKERKKLVSIGKYRGFISCEA